MKNRISLLGIIAIVAIIGFSMTACDDGNGSTTGGNTGGNNGGTTYKIGDTGPGGGIVFYDKGSVSNGWRYLEAAPVNQGTSLKWASYFYESTYITGTESAIGTGKANTAAILAVDGNAPAAKACADYRGGGKSDWFLPSKDELNEMYQARSHLDISGLFWSSSQSNPNFFAWVQYFLNGYDGDGYQNNGSKNDGYDVRAIRAF